jgi:hypothetical protein
VLTAVLLASAGIATGQGTSGSRRIEGKVTRSLGGGRTAPVPAAWVILHRVGADAAAPLDSMRTRADGSYAFRYRPTGDTTAIYFVSTVSGGVAYFTPPSREEVVRGGTADLAVFDTTSAAMPITIRGRHIIVTAPDSATPNVRTIIEVYELSNDSSMTRVPGTAGRFTFEAPLPSGVTEVAGGQGDISPDALRVEGGHVRVYAPIAPGLKQFSFFYELPRNAALSYPIDANVPVLEVLLEDARGTAVGAELLEVNAVMVEGRPFKRYLAQDVLAPSMIDITAPGPAADSRRLRLMLVLTAVGAAMLLGLGAAFMRRGPAAFGRRRARDPEAIALEIAALDARFAAVDAPSVGVRATHYVERARLMGDLRSALARRDGLS